MLDNIIFFGFLANKKQQMRIFIMNAYLLLCSLQPLLQYYLISALDRSTPTNLNLFFA